MNRERYALKEISKIINKVYKTNICLCCNNYMITHTNEYMKTGDFGKYYMNVIEYVYNIVNINENEYSINEMDYIYDIMRLINTY